MKFSRFKGLAVALAVTAASFTMAAPASAATTYTYTYTVKVPAGTSLTSLLSKYFPQATVKWYTPKTTTQTTPAKQPQTQQQTAQQTTKQPTQATAQQPTQQTTTAVSGLTAAEQQMLNLVNQERARAGLKPLQADLQLTKLARLKSQDMINKNYFSHTSPTYGSPFDMMKSNGVTYKTAGENIAGNQSVQAAHTALMNSSGHRANILNANYTHVGIGIVQGGPYGMMFTQMFVGR